MRSNLLRVLSDIEDGWKRLIWKQNESEKLAIERLAVCVPCNKRIERGTLRNTCRACGCYLPAKVRAIRSSCPLKKWKDD